MTETKQSGFGPGAAIVFGGSGAIGSAICQALARDGADVALSYRGNSDAAEQTADRVRALGRRAITMKVEMTDPESVARFVDHTIEQFGAIHSVVYSAGPPLEFLYINEITPDEWARVVQADVNGCFNMVHSVLPHLRRQHSGNIVALVTGAVDRSPPRDILSAAPKAAIQMLIRGVAREEGRSGIRANLVGPGYIEAGLGLTAIREHSEDYVNRMVRAIPMRRPGQAEEVAEVVSFLLSPKSGYVTGATIPVAGGLQLS